MRSATPIIEIGRTYVMRDGREVEAVNYHPASGYVFVIDQSGNKIQVHESALKIVMTPDEIRKLES